MNWREEGRKFVESLDLDGPIRFPKNEEEVEALGWYLDALNRKRLIPARINSEQQIYLRDCFGPINHLRSYDYE